MISRQLFSILAVRYGIEPIHNVRVLEGGEWKKLLWLESDKGIFVLSISHPTTIVEGIAFEHDLLSYMNRYFPEVPAPIVANDGTTYFLHNGRVATLFPFMLGAIANDELEPVRIEAARMLARLHQAFLSYLAPASRPGICALRELNWDHNQWWDWAEVFDLLSLDDSKSKGSAHRFWEDGLPFTREIIQRKSQIEAEKELFSH